MIDAKFGIAMFEPELSFNPVAKAKLKIKNPVSVSVQKK